MIRARERHSKGGASRNKPRDQAAIAGAAVFALLAAQSPAIAQAVCFPANGRLPFAVFQQAPPPRLNARSYRYYPLTAAASMKLADLEAPAAGSGGDVDRYYFQWANRFNGARTLKANLEPGLEGAKAVRATFSSVALADACTLAQTAAVLGQDAGRLGASGLRLVPEASAPPAGLAGAGDLCLLPLSPNPGRLAGVMLDYEVQDGRTPVQSAAFLTRFAALVHSARRRAILYTDPLDAPSQAYTGLTAANVGSITEHFDMTTVFLWSGNRQHDIAASAQAQIAELGGPDRRPFDAHRLLLVFELAGTSQTDAVTVRRLMQREPVGGVMFWRRGAEQGGDCASPVNRKIACVVFGRCGPATPDVSS